MNHHQRRLFVPSPFPIPNPNPTFTLPPLPPPPDLSTSLSLLNNILSRSNSTLLSLPPLPTNPSSQCPSNPNHFLPPSYLFLHSLHCPSPLSLTLTLSSLHYPQTLQSQPQSTNSTTNCFLPDSDLLFSLDDYLPPSSNFFYLDSPGVVNSSNDDLANRIFSLPALLSAECANFPNTEFIDPVPALLLLPSELWFVNCEIEQWNDDFPTGFSYGVLKAVLGIERVKEGELLVWLIMNSPRFGVVIDSSMAEHLFVLLRVCVKAVFREARRSYESSMRGDLISETVWFGCQPLADVLSWLATLLSVLYGELNAQRFTIGMFKQLLLNVVSSSLVYPLERNLGKVVDGEWSFLSSVVAFQPSDQVVDNDGNGVVSGGFVSKCVFVYQVAVAVAALHERALLEEYIKTLRRNQCTTASQWVAEHAFMTQKAQEERKKRPNYRPIVEHDGLPVQPQYDKDMADKNKSKEQLLAEERDYKRRRMSYRGKKVNRNVKEVTRDIIEEHMEAIREAGGIGCFDKDIENGSLSTYQPLAQEYGQNKDFNRSTSYDYEPSRTHHNANKRQVSYNSSSQTMEPHEQTRERKVNSNMHRDDLNHRIPGREKTRGESRNPMNKWRETTDEYNFYLRSPSSDISYVQWRSQRKTETEEGDSYPRREKSYSSMRDLRKDCKKEDEKSGYYTRVSGTERKSRQSRHLSSDRKLEREEGDSNLRSPSKEKHGISRDQRSAWRDVCKEDIYKSRSTSKTHGNGSSFHSTTSHSDRKDKRRFEDPDNDKRKRVINDRSDSVANSEFDDRYDPSRSPET